MTAVRESDAEFFDRMRRIGAELVAPRFTTVSPHIQLTPKRMGAPSVPPSRQIDTTSLPCPSRREGDQIVCPRCMLRWDVSESRPECPK